MILIPAPGSSELQRASKDRDVLKIVEILLKLIREDSTISRGFFSLAARFIKNLDKRTLPDFEKGIQALRLYHQR